jgi:hypothetical protein
MNIEFKKRNFTWYHQFSMIIWVGIQTKHDYWFHFPATNFYWYRIYSLSNTTLIFCGLIWPSQVLSYKYHIVKYLVKYSCTTGVRLPHFTNYYKVRLRRRINIWKLYEYYVNNQMCKEVVRIKNMNLFLVSFIMLENLDSDWLHVVDLDFTHRKMLENGKLLLYIYISRKR